MAGFTSAETFACRLTFGPFIRRYIPMIVWMSLLFLLITRALSHALGAGAFGWPLAFALTAGFAVALIMPRKYQFERTWGTTVLELSPGGATMVNRHSRVYLPWDRTDRVGKADLIDHRPAFVHGPLPAGLLDTLLSLLTRRPGKPALIGAGATTVEPGTPRLVRAQIRENHGCRQVDPATGRRLTAIVLTIFDENWQHGRIGEWIGAYRPDLLPGR